ncbi:SIS domain-containing protein [Proteiniclasticum sp. SCR006]|uniref:SIS domain-containing protein n=1 Tax=Proteiniclasticum aestuarii TaxID=2817862 RepID=A0A939KH11_9CLOT|nr:SIS domain-containing protein [Proteiniclasticum aestuarii]MBO1266097.1 SIS domain-containing protein [Proteiniclasticum aestuarii]
MKKGTVMKQYKEEVFKIINEIHEEESDKIVKVAEVIAEHIKKDRLVHIWGPGGHSNLAAMEIFFRAGGLMHVNAILNTDTMLNNGALKSMNVERLPGYGRIVIEDQGIGEGDLLIVVNAYGINTATIDAALTAKEKGALVIGISSHDHANDTPANHIARHPSKKNLQDIVDYSVDCKLAVGDACISLDGFEQKIGALSTFANAFVLNSIVIETINILVEEGIHPPVWMSGNADGGDEWNKRFMGKFRDKIKML